MWMIKSSIVTFILMFTASNLLFTARQILDRSNERTCLFKEENCDNGLENGSVFLGQSSAFTSYLQQTTSGLISTPYSESTSSNSDLFGT